MARMNSHELYLRLRVLVGRHCLLEDGEWQILDILEDETALVIQRLSGSGGIQSDAYGNPLRMAPETRTVRYTDETGQISDEAGALLASLQRS